MRTIYGLFMISAEQVVPSAHELKLPDFDTFRESREENSTKPKKGLLLDDEDKLWEKKGIIRILHLDEELKLKLLVALPFCGTSWYRCQEERSQGNVLSE